MALPAPIDPASVPRQVIPFGDRPMVEPSSGRATNEFYQWAQRLAVGFGATTTNVTQVITVINELIPDLEAILVAIALIQAELVAIEAQIAALGSPPPPALPSRVGGSGIGTAMMLDWFSA